MHISIAILIMVFYFESEYCITLLVTTDEESQS